MCCEDMTIGHESKSQPTVIAVPAAAVQLVMASPNRIALVFGNPSIGAVGITTLQPTAATDGMQLTPTSPPIMLNIRDHGDLVQRSWFAFGTVPLNMTVWEVFQGKTCDGKR